VNATGGWKRRTSEAVILASDHAALARRVERIPTIARRKPWIAGAIAGVAAVALAVAITLRLTGDDTTKEASVMGGRAICRAVFPELLHRGEQVGVRVSIQNVTDTDLTVPGVATLSVQDKEGRVLADSSHAIRSVDSADIEPGVTRDLFVEDVRVRWDGPLTLTARCFREEVPAAVLDVAS
jgi:hypothetical protein